MAPAVGAFAFIVLVVVVVVPGGGASSVGVGGSEPIDDDESWRGLGSPTSVGASRRSNVGVSAWEGTGDEASESSWMGIKRLCDCDAFSADSGKHDW